MYIALSINVLTFGFLFASVPDAGRIKGFEPTYLTARYKAAEMNKPCLIFVTEDNNRQAAWMEEVLFTDKDVLYNLNAHCIAGIINTSDFDGSLLRNKLGLSRSPSLAILNPDGTVRSVVNHGFSKEKFIAWMQFYFDPSNAGKSYEADDPAFETVVSNWQGGALRNTVPQLTQSEPVIRESKPSKEKAEPISTFHPDKPATPVAIDATEVVEQAVTTDTEKSSVIKENMPALAAPIKAAATTSENSYIVQAGVFGAETNAQSLVQKLKGAGFTNAQAEIITASGKQAYRVTAAAYPTEADATVAVQRLSNNGIKAIIKKSE